MFTIWDHVQSHVTTTLVQGQGWIRGQMSYDYISSQLNNFLSIWRILEWLTTNVHHTETMCRVHVTAILVQGQGRN